MITTTELAKRTGLSTKTLTRWAEKGILPKPKVSTHPRGRGKVGYWPDSVLERCQKIQALRKEGHDLETAALMLQMDSVRQRVDATLNQTSIADVLSNKKIRVDGDREASLMDILLSIVVSDLTASVVDRDSHNTIVSAIRQDDLLRIAVSMIQNGYNPFLTFDGEKVRIEPDFLLGHMYETTGPTKRSIFLLPLFPPVRKFFDALGAGDHLKDPVVTPAPKVWNQEGDVTVEYTIVLGGPRGFELVRGSASVVGTLAKTKGPHDDA